jgi:thiol-disulfide isomerase/thioredoxin
MSETDPIDPTPETQPAEATGPADATPALAAREPAAAETPSGPAPLGRQAKIAVTLLAVLALGALLWPRGESSFEAPGGFPVDATGRPVPLASRLAPVTLVHFWATWCPPCITEIPALKRLAEDFSDERDFDLVMIAVGDEPQNVEEFLGSLAPMALFDPSWDIAHRYGTRKLPETYLVVGGRVVETDSQARLRRETGLKLDGDSPRWVGQTDWGDPRIRTELRRILDGLGAGSGDSPST